MLKLLHSKHSGPPKVEYSDGWYIYLSEQGNSISRDNHFNIEAKPLERQSMEIEINGIKYQYQLAGSTFMFKQRGLPPPLMPGYEQGGNPFEQQRSLQPCEHRYQRTFVNGCCPKTVSACKFYGEDLGNQCDGCKVPTDGTGILEDDVVIEPGND